MRLRVALAAAVATAALFGCVDLFHSTDFGEAACLGDAGSCGDGSAEAGTVHHRDGGSGARDGSLDHEGSVHDARTDGTHGDSASDAGVDAGPVEAGTNFCNFSPDAAAANAQHACTILGTCAGNTDLNDFGACYPNALLAYDCSLNPNQEVRGPLHAYWDALWQATTCADVLAAIFPGGVPACNNAVAACAEDLGGAGSRDTVTICSDGGFASAVNCEMRGYTCVNGVCANGGPTCTGSSTGACAGDTLYSCQTVENAAGTGSELRDVGRNCAYFGAGKCVLDPDAGAYGCMPNDASVACHATTAVLCSDAGVVTGCATGHEETVRCTELGPSSQCGSSWTSSGRDLVGGCFNPSSVGGGQRGCIAPGFEESAGASGIVTVSCPDGGCDLNPATGEPYCSTP